VKKGYGCKVASDADHALAKLGQQHFDLVISDIAMGEKDGIALMKEVRELYPQLEFSVNVLSNLKELVFPYVEKLRTSRLNEIQDTYLTILESHLEEISAPFLRKLSSEFTNLSPMELKIATLIKEGNQNKEMAQMLGVSVNTILTRRYHLRNKLGLKNKDINLRSCLKSVDTWQSVSLRPWNINSGGSHPGEDNSKIRSRSRQKRDSAWAA
jgi:DNA-binding NarL/FixJ family response regulator